MLGVAGESAAPDAARCTTNQGQPLDRPAGATLGFFMILLDTTIVNIAVPSMEKGLSASFDQILWILNAYILVYAVLLITTGRLGDMLGPKRLFIVGLVLFTLSSAACGFAQSSTQLIIFRIIQGVGGAMLTPQTLAVITSIFPPERRGAAFGVWGAVGGFAAVVGPTLGGFLVTTASWRAIFYINVPIGVIAVGAAILLMPEVQSHRRHELDITGVALASIGLFLGVFALIESQRFNWGPIATFGSFSIGSTRWSVISIYSLLVYSLVLLVTFVALERGKREPLLPLALFSDRNFSVANVVSASVSYAILGVFLPLTIFLQSVLGFTAVHAGLTLIPMSATSLFTAGFAGRLSDKINGKYILMFGSTCFALGMALVVRALSLSDTSWDLTIPLVVSGLGMGCTFAPMVTLAMRDVRPQMAGSASGFLNTIRQVGQALGGAVGGAILGNAVASNLVVQARAVAVHVPAAYRARFLAGFEAASRGGQRFGSGQTPAAHLPAGTPPQAARLIAHLFRQAFDQAFLNGMRPAMLVAVGCLLAAGIAAGFMRGGRTAQAAQREVPAERRQAAS
ncbi:MAG TPA: MDR family MFS transporter [Chloroflexota bacterium]|nr:MDR family MFS transporter [Chloroflexota bacterium]